MTAAQIQAGIARFVASIQAVAPGSLAHGNPDGTVTIEFAPGATQPQRDAANAAAATFDWSPAAQAAYVNALDDTQWPDLALLRSQATAAVQGNNAYLAIVSPTTQQRFDQLDAITRQNTQLVKSLGAVILRLTGR